MTGTPAARAAVSSFLIFGIWEMHRGLRVGLQVCWLKSSISSAVVLGSTVTGFSAGAGGGVTDAHSSMIICPLATCATMQQAVPAMAAIRDNKYACRVSI